MKLESIEKANNGTHKYMATFCLCPGSKSNCCAQQKKTVRFGAKGYTDYTIDATDGQRKNYIARHRKNENFEDSLTAGSLSRYILWGKSRDIDKNIADFKDRFNL